MNKFAKLYGDFGRKAYVGAVLSAPLLAFATPSADYSAITDAVDFETVATAVVAIAAVIALALVAKKGARMVLGMIGR